MEFYRIEFWLKNDSLVPMTVSCFELLLIIKLLPFLYLA
jgi:hypothetical protein